MPDTSDMHIQVTAAAVWAMQEAALKGFMSPIKAYSSDVHGLDSVEDTLQVACMTTDDWHQAQQADLVLGLTIVRIQVGPLSQCQLKATSPPRLWQFLREHNHLKLRWGIHFRKTLPKESQEALFQLVLLAAYKEIALKGCHVEVGHLGLECMLGLVHDHFWPHMAVQAKEHIEQLSMPHL